MPRNILSEGITDAMAAAPKAPVKAADDALAANREADKMVADPTLAYAAQAEMLEQRLSSCRPSRRRADRFGRAHRRAAHPGSQGPASVPAPRRRERGRT